jgi:hypothetical protein
MQVTLADSVLKALPDQNSFHSYLLAKLLKLVSIVLLKILKIHRKWTLEYMIILIR